MTASAVITSKGTKGFLTWLKNAQPAVYQSINKKVIAHARGQAASNAMSGLLNCIPMKKSGLGDLYANYYSSSAAPISAGDAGAGLTIPDLNVQSNTTDSATAASNGNMSSGLASLISGAANAFSTVTLSQAQINANNTLLQTNLLRAQQGLPPLTTTVNAQGITTLSSSMLPILLIGGAAVLAVSMSKK